MSAYAMQPVAYVRAEFDIGGLRLADFEPRPPAPEVPFCMLPLHSGANVAEQSGETQTIQSPAASL